MMLTLILSTLGIGGLGTLAFLFVPGAAPFMLRALTWATANAARMLAVGLAVALAWGALGWHNAAKHKRVRESTEQAYRNAQKDAKLAQEALNSAIAARYQTQAKEADHGYELAKARAAASSDSYIARNRVRACTTCPASGADSPPQGDSAPSDESPDPAPGMVAVTADDIRICADNTERLVAGREWALGLIRQGLAD